MSQKKSRLNVKALVILLLVICLLGVGLVGGHYVRKRVIANRALNEGRALLAKGDWPQACKQLRRYLAQHPDDVEILEAYGDAHLAVRPRTPENISAAAGAYRRLLRHRRSDKVISHRLAAMYIAAGDYENAQYICSARLADDPLDSEAAVLLARILLQRNKPEEAAALLRPIVEARNPDALDAYSMLCRISLDMDETETGLTEAKSWLDLAINNHPQAVQPLIDRAVFYRDSLNNRKPEDFEQSRADLEAAEALNPVDPDQRLRLARAWIQLNELQHAKEILEPLADTDGELFLEKLDDPARFRLERYRVAAALYRRLHDVEAMGSLADEALTVLPKQFRALFLSSAVELYVEAGRPDEAQKALDEYLTLVDRATHGRSAGDAELVILQARVAMAADRPFEVINQLRPLVVWHQESIEAWHLLGDAYQRTGQRALALAAFTAASERGDNDVAAMAQLARAHLRQRDWADAFRLAQTCESLDPDVADLKLMRIEAEMRIAFGQEDSRDTLDRLARELAQLRNEQPQYAPIAMLEALLAEHHGDLERAEALLREAVAARGETMDAFSALVSLLERTGRPEDALQTCHETIERYPEAARPWLTAARLEVAAGRPEDARDTLEGAALMATKQTDVLNIRMAMARLQLTHFDRAAGIATLRSIAEADDRNMDSRLALLEMPEIMADRSLAQRYVDQLKNIEGDTGLWWRLHQARVWMADDSWRDHVEETLKALAQCVERRPRWWPRASLLLAGFHTLRGDAAAAEDVYREALALNPNAVEIADRLLKLLESQGRFADAQRVLDDMTMQAPKLGDHRIGVAIGNGDYDRAIQELETRAIADPTAAEPRIVLASLHYGWKRDVDRAFKLLDEAAALDPEGLGPIAMRVRILVSEDRTDEARALLDEEVAKRDNFQIYALRAEFHLQRGDQEAAERDFRRLTQFPDSSAIGYQMLGRFYAMSDRTEDAIAAWEDGLAVDPAREALRRPLMRALISSPDPQRRERGRELLDELLALHPGDVDLLRVHAFRLYASDTPTTKQEAMAVLEQVVEKDPNAVGAHLALIDTTYRAGRFDDASVLVTRALEANPRDASLLTAAAQVSRASRKLSVARGLARSALDANPEHLPAYVFLIEDALHAGKIATADELMDSALSLAPDDPIVRLKRAALLEMKGEYVPAIEILEDLLAADEKINRLVLRLSLADLYCATGDAARHESNLTAAVDIAPDHPAIMETRLGCLARQGRFDAIASLISEYQANHPEELNATLLAAKMLTRSGTKRHVAVARSLYEQAIAANPRSVEAHLGVARAAHLSGETEAVVRSYREVLKIDHDHPQALNDLAWVLADSGDALDEALRLTDHGVESFPADPHLRDTRGVVLLKLGRLEPAVEELRRAVDFSPELPGTRAKALVHLADAYIAQNRSAAARQRLIEARRIDETNQVFNDRERKDLDALLKRL